MANLDAFHAKWTPHLQSVLRIITGFLFMAHGAQKLFGFLAPPGAPTAATGSLMWVGGVLEFFGGLLFSVGLVATGLVLGITQAVHRRRSGAPAAGG